MDGSKNTVIPDNVLQNNLEMNCSCYLCVGLHSGVNHEGTERDCLPQSVDWGTAVLTAPKVQASEGQCWVLLREIS